ncbi:MAG: hypothetical protein HZA90_20335 [Verrucomicrobia bacterium]|nr:hypothetical protein [Verrucomicrobiota bacterium]
MKTTTLLRGAATPFLAIALLIGARNAPAAANDHFADAAVISALPYTISSSNADATRQPGEPAHYGSTNGHSVWWTWTAPSSGPMQINCLGSSIRSVVAVYTGAAVGSLTPVASGRGNHLVNFAAVAGTTYHIALDSLDAGSYGSFTFRLLDGVAPPANDAFADATVITGNSCSLSGHSNAGATKEPGEPAHAGDLGGKSVWWKWTAPASGTFQLETTGSTFDTLLAVYAGSSVGSLSLIASNDNFSGMTSLVTFSAVAGMEYRFVVDGWAAREGQITLILTPPSNDAFANATVATLSGGVYYGVNGVFNTNATKEAGEPNHAGNAGGKSLWWAWTAPANGSCHVDTIGSAFNTLLAVYTGQAVNSLTEIASNDDSPMMPPASELSFNATAGTTYRIAVDGYSGASDWITLNLLFAPITELIVNGDFEAGNAGFSNDYVYSPADMTPQGVYCVVANPASVMSNWGSFGDHTTGTGLMLLANGDANPTNTVWRQTILVATNAAYLFSAWAASAYPENPARFFFFVNGQQQGNSVVLPSANGLWQNYSVIWSSSNSVTALLEIRMLSTEFFGNDFVLDDLSFRRLAVDLPPPHLSIQHVIAEAAVVLSWPSVLNQLYQLQWVPGLETNQWFSLDAPRLGTGSAILVTNSIEGSPRRFFRVIPVN